MFAEDRLTGERIGKGFGLKGLIAFGACVLAAIVVLAGPTARAQAAEGWFCLGAWLQPYGQPNDSCGQNISYTNHMQKLTVLAGEHAACIRGLGYYGEPQTAWQCAAAGTSNAIYFPNDGRWTRGEIRNNNLTYPTAASGYYVSY